MPDLRWISQQLKNCAPTMKVYQDGFGINNRTWRLTNISLNNITHNLHDLTAMPLRLFSIIFAAWLIELSSQEEIFFDVEQTPYKFIYEKFLNKITETLKEANNKYNATVTSSNDAPYEKILEWEISSHINSKQVAFLYRAMNEFAHEDFENLFNADVLAVVRKEKTRQAFQDLMIVILLLGTLCGIIFLCHAYHSPLRVNLKLKSQKKEKEKIMSINQQAESEEEEIKVVDERTEIRAEIKNYGSIRSTKP